MPSFPNRCQRIKVNGAQCGSPALRRNRFCYFHKRHHEERIELNGDRLKNSCHRRGSVAIDLPVLEDANSVQVSLMQVMHLLVAGDIDGKIAGLLFSALQTASGNLGRTNFNPDMYQVVLDPGAVDETPLGARIWDDSDFADDADGEEDDEDDETKKRRAELSSQIVVKNGRVELAGHILKGFPTSVRPRAAREIESKMK